MQSKHPLLWPEILGHARFGRRLRALALKGGEQALEYLGWLRIRVIED